MREILTFVIAGIATGAIYGLAGTGLVLTYKTSGIFNFGHGAIAAVAAYTFYAMHVQHRIDWKLSMVVSVVAVGVVIGWIMAIVSERLTRQRTEMRIVGTIGLILLAQSAATIVFGPKSRFVTQFLPKGRQKFRIVGINITYDLIIITAIAVFAVGVLYALFRWSRRGVEMRAVVDDPDLLAMQAIDPASIRRVAWIIGANFAALSGVLVTPLLGLDATVLTFLVVQAFGAAAIGYMSSIPLTFLGGLIIGILANVSKKYVVDISWLSGLPSALPFITLFIVLLVMPRHRLTAPTSTPRLKATLHYVAAPRIRVGTAVAVLGAFLVVPHVVGAKLPFFTGGLITMLMLLSLGLLVRTSGQVSLAHATFAAVGAVVFSQLRFGHGMPWLLAALIASLAAVPVGMVVAIPAIRLSGLYLALATFGFGILVQRLFYSQNFMFTPFITGRPMPRPSVAVTEFRYYHLVLLFVVLVAILMVVVHRSRLGRFLRAMSDSPTAITTMGLSTNVTRVVVFSISSFLAALGGILYGVSTVYATPSSTFYTPFYSLVLLAMLALAPFGVPWYALVPAAAAVIPAYWQSGHSADYLNLAFGLFAVMIAMQGAHPPMPARLRQLLDRLGRPSRVGHHDEPMQEADDRAATVDWNVRRPDRRGLVVSELSVHFGGLVAVDGVSFNAPPARITGLIGPNGAGKTTIFNAVSGLNRRYTGSVQLHGEELAALSPAARSRRGLGRTFQRLELCNSLSVFDNVSLGNEAGLAGARPLSQLSASRTQRIEIERATRHALDLTGIADLAQLQAGSLSTGQRRLVELARCIAGPFDILLLDEPSSGLDADETAKFGALIRRLVVDRGVGFLLVEHDMELVMDVCDNIYVVEFGRLIAQGTPLEISTSEAVQTAYLGVPGAT